MIRQFIQTTFRQITPIAGFSFTKVAGIAAGLAICCEAILLLQKAPAETPALPHYDRVCKVSLEARFGDIDGLMSKTPAMAGSVLAGTFMDVEMFTRAYYPDPLAVQRVLPIETPVLDTAPRVVAVDANFAEMFSLSTVAGSAVNCLKNNTSAVLTASIASKLFGSAAAAVGESLLVGKMKVQVTAVVDDQQPEAPVAFDILLPMDNFKVVERNAWNWTWLKTDTWVRVKNQPEPAYLAGLEKRFPVVIDAAAAASFERVELDFNEIMAAGGKFQLRLTPISEPLKAAIACGAGCPEPSRHFTFGVLGFHLKNML